MNVALSGHNCCHNWVTNTSLLYTPMYLCLYVLTCVLGHVSGEVFVHYNNPTGKLYLNRIMNKKTFRIMNGFGRPLKKENNEPTLYAGYLCGQQIMLTPCAEVPEDIIMLKIEILPK